MRFRAWRLAREERRELGFPRVLSPFIRGGVARTKFSRGRRRRPALSKKLMRRAVAGLSSVAPRTPQANTLFFKNTVGRALVRNAALTEACSLYTKFYQQTPFETHRPRL